MLFYDAEIRQNERVLSVSLRGNFEKIRIMTTFGSRVTQRGRQFEVRALYKAKQVSQNLIQAVEV